MALLASGITSASSLPPGWRLLLLAVVLLVSASGCASVSSMKPERSYLASPAPPPEIGAVAENEDLALTLETVISPGGSGSWFKDAPWDEYIVTVRNDSEATVTVETFQLVDQRGVYVPPESEMDLLAARTEDLAKEYKKIGIAGAVGGVATQGLGFAAAGFLGATAAAAAPIAVLAAPAYILWRRHVAKEDKASIDDEFQERVLPTRMSLAPGGEISGSVFFPLVAGPGRLVAVYAVGQERRELALDLREIAAGTP